MFFFNTYISAINNKEDEEKKIRKKEFNGRLGARNKKTERIDCPRDALDLGNTMFNWFFYCCNPIIWISFPLIVSMLRFYIELLDFRPKKVAGPCKLSILCFT